MTDRKLVLLGVIAAAMVILAVVTSNVPEKRGGGVSKPSYLVQGVDPDNIAGIQVVSGDNTVTLKRKKGQFVVDEKSGYPALAGKINGLVSDVMDIKTVELCTDNASNHADLSVTEDKAETVVKFFNPDGTELTGVIIGKEKEQGQGTFVRLISDDRVYLTLDRQYLPADPISYVDQNLIAVERENIDSVKVADKQNGTYTLSKNENGKIVLEDMPEDTKLKDAEASKVFNMLSSLRFEDVVKEGAKDLSFDKKYVCNMKDSTRYTLDIAQADDKTYVKVSAAYTDDSKITVTRGGNESEEELKAKEEKLLARDNAVKFEQEHNGWVYQLPSYLAGGLTKNVEDLIEVKPEEKPAEPKEQSAPADAGGQTEAAEEPA